LLSRQKAQNGIPEVTLPLGDCERGTAGWERRMRGSVLCAPHCGPPWDLVPPARRRPVAHARCPGEAWRRGGRGCWRWGSTEATGEARGIPSGGCGDVSWLPEGGGTGSFEPPAAAGAWSAGSEPGPDCPGALAGS